MFKLCWKLLKPMAEIIPDQILDAALKEIANFSDAEARAEIDRIVDQRAGGVDPSGTPQRSRRVC